MINMYINNVRMNSWIQGVNTFYIASSKGGSLSVVWRQGQGQGYRSRSQKEVRTKVLGQEVKVKDGGHVEGQSQLHCQGLRSSTRSRI